MTRKCWAVVDGEFCGKPGPGRCEEHRPAQAHVDPERTAVALMAKAEQERRHRVVEPGPRCSVCLEPMSATLAAAEPYPMHPTCDPDYEDLLEERRRRRYRADMAARRDASARRAGR